MSTADHSAIVIGAGPAGLAAAAQLQRVGFAVTVLDQASEVGSSWSRHYDRLHLHTSRALSSLPGWVMPRRYGQWVARDDFRQYLADYAAREKLDVRLGVTATAIRQSSDMDAPRWNIDWHDGKKPGSTPATVLVVATGYNHTPAIPAWPGLTKYRGRVVHSSQYRNPAALNAESVLVVGPGNSGAEIAADLAAAGAEVKLAIRTVPNIVRRSVLGIPGQALVIATNPFGPAIGDRVARLLQILTVGNLSDYGLPKAPRGVFTQMKRDDVTPTIDVGLIDAVKSGSVTIVPAVESFTTNAVTLADGSVVTPDAVVVATGYQRGLESLVGPLDVIGPHGKPLVNGDGELRDHEGLYFLGYSNPLTGNIRAIGIDAKAIAKKARRLLA